MSVCMHVYTYITFTHTPDILSHCKMLNSPPNGDLPIIPLLRITSLKTNSLARKATSPPHLTKLNKLRWLPLLCMYFWHSICSTILTLLVSWSLIRVYASRRQGLSCWSLQPLHLAHIYIQKLLDKEVTLCFYYNLFSTY